MTMLMVTRYGAAAAVAGALGLGSAFVDEAQAKVCTERGKMQKVLADRYQEITRGLGLVSEKGVVELYTSEAGTWSIVVTSPTGASCIIAAGHAWQDVTPEPLGPEA